ncbi:MAG: sulfite exporter TauE/SafE family protein [Faecalibacterium sp.]
MALVYTIFIAIFAGMGAGLGTGLAGMSAAAVISPVLVTFLGMDAYEAIGIALASDVLASAISAYTYGKNKNLDIKNGSVMMAAVLLFTLVGSFVSSHVESTVMGNFSVFATTGMGLKFLLFPVTTSESKIKSMSTKERVLKSVVGGCGIGFICGFIGAGGGIMMLIILTTILGYELKTAVGTSVFIMSFTALTGAASHFAISGTPDILCLVVCVASTFIWAQLAARFANRVSPMVMNRALGVLLFVLGLIMIAMQYLF